MRKLAQIVCSNHLVVAIDILAANLGILLAFVLRFGAGFTQAPNFHAYLYCIPFLVVLTTAVMYVNDLYANWIHRNGSQLATSLLVSTAMLSVYTMALSFWGRQFTFPRSVIAISFVLQAILFVMSRRFIQYLHREYIGPQRVLVIGEDEQAVATLVTKFEQHSPSQFAVVGFLPAECVPDLHSRLSEVDIVAISATVADKAEAVEICSRYNKGVLIVPRVVDLLLHTARTETIDDILMFSIRPSSQTPGQLLMKRFVDVLISGLMILVTAPLMLLVAILVPLTSRGGPIFRQERVGRHGSRYFIYKFRTMIADAEKHTGPVLAEKDDERITRLGRILRSTRLDELPQLFNVLRGEMSLVGPRPERPFFVRQFEHSIPNYSLRMMVKPGITGLAQVKGRYDSTAERKLRFDLLYLREYSLVLDIKIMLQTLLVIFEPRQACGVDNVVAQLDAANFKSPQPPAVGDLAANVNKELASSAD